ncbi:hypothetical protein [Pseudomonas fluorescens]|uniref:hypothetical protein n=1 Tax=Pseudomonas fluorescens TaxID=294 RepID=UPI0012499068|nr:hypothetical protein [Pseudomonas fluorescens]
MAINEHGNTFELTWEVVMKSREAALPQNNFSLVEQCQLKALLDEARSSASAYTGNFTAPWLLTPIHSNIWQMKKGAQTRCINGKWVDFYTYNWSTLLPDGSNLVDHENKMLLQGMQRLAFIVRELPGGPSSILSLMSFLRSLNFFVRWIFLNEEKLNPRLYFFSKMTQQHFTDLFIDISKGGVVFALNYPERFLKTVFPLAIGRAPYDTETTDPLNLPKEVCHAIAKWLKSNGHLKKMPRATTEKFGLLPKNLARLINVDPESTVGGQKWQVFLRQFDVSDSLPEHHEYLVHSICTTTREMPTQRAITTDQAKSNLMSEGSARVYLNDLKYIITAHRHLPGFCPNPKEFKSKELNQLINSLTTTGKHTPWVPLNIAMSYTTEALRWVHVYGDDLVSTFLIAYQDLYTKGLLVSRPPPEVSPPH